MEEEMNTEILEFDAPKAQSSYIKVIGVGGGGGNAVNHMFREGIEGVDFYVCNTDKQALQSSPVPNKLELSKLGAGGRPEVGRKAAQAHADIIKEALSHDTKMLFITAGMGGGTGTGAAPVVAEIAKQIDIPPEEEYDDEAKKILVVAVVTKPFTFEGRRKMALADDGIAELRKHVDSILIINNDKLRSFGNMAMTDAFGKANDVLLTAVKGIAEIITKNAILNVDFRDVNTVMEHSDTALMGVGIGKGEERALDAAKSATESVLLNDNDIAGAKNVLFHISYSDKHPITMDELETITDYISSKTQNDDSAVIWGAGADNSLDDELKLTLIATGFAQSENSGTETGKVFDGTKVPELDPNCKKPEPQPVPVAPIDEIHIKPQETTPETPIFTAPQKLVDDQGTADNSGAGRKWVLNMDGEFKEEKAEEPQLQDAVDTPTSWADGMHLQTASVETMAPADVTLEPVTDAATTMTEAQQKTADQLANSAFQPYQDERTDAVFDRAERIRRMNALLKQDPDGPQKVENMTTAELTNELIYQTPHSSKSEASDQAVGRSGDMKNLNSFLFTTVD